MNAIPKIKTNAEASASVKIDRQRMEKALASKSTAIPNGLTREQMRKFILEN